MSIKSTEYVFITSGVVGASVAQQELIGRRFTTDPRVPVGSILRVASGEADSFFGAQSAEAAFARQYFSVVLPAPVSRPGYLQFAAYAPAGRVPRVYGRTITATVADFVANTGQTLTLDLGGSPETTAAINLDAAVTFADVASAVQAAIRSLTGSQYASATVTYDALSGSFNLAGTTAAPAAVSVAVGSLAGLLGWNGLGVILSPGVAAQTPIEAFQAAEQVTDSFGSASFGSPIQLGDALPLAQYVAGENVKYMMLWTVDELAFEAWSAAMLGIASNGLVLNRTAGEYKEAIPQGIQAASNYEMRNAGAVNYMFRQAGLTADVTDTQESRTLNADRINYYGQTAVFGQRIDFFQRGYLMGGATAPLDMSVHSGEQWLKSYAASRFFALQIGTRGIPNNNDGRGMMLGALHDATRQAFFNGVMSVGKLLTSTQIEAVTQITGDPMAYLEVQNKGYWADVLMTEDVTESGVTEYVAQYTLVYATKDMVRRIVGSHNLV